MRLSEIEKGFYTVTVLSSFAVFFGIPLYGIYEWIMEKEEVWQDPLWWVAGILAFVALWKSAGKLDNDRVKKDKE